MIAPVFVDSNVLIYALDKGDPKKSQAAGAWRTKLEEPVRPNQLSGVVRILYESHPEMARQDDASDQVRDLLAWKGLLR